MDVLQVSHNDLSPFLSLCRTHAAALGRIGAAVTTVYLSGAGHGADDPHTVYLSRGPLEGGAWRAATELRRRFAERRFGLVLTHRYKAYTAVLLARRRLSADRVVAMAHEYGFLARRRRRWVRRWFAADVELAGVSHAVADDLCRHDPLRANALVLHNVVDVAAHDSHAMSRADARARLAIGIDELAVGVVGRLNRKKRPDVALRVFADAAGRLPFSLHFLGTGEERASVDALALERGVSGRVVMHGFVPDAAQLMAAFDVLLFAAPREAFGMVLVEALLAGVPVLAADSPGAREVLGPLGQFFPVGDPGSASEELARLLEIPATELARWRGEARERIMQLFSVDALAASYRLLLGRDGTGPGAVF